MYAQKADGTGYMKIETSGHKMYYKNAGTGTQLFVVRVCALMCVPANLSSRNAGEPREPFEFPHGFRMVAGDPFMRGPAPADGGRQNITQWICHMSNGRNQGTDGGFPTGITNCDAYPGFNGAIHFPHCWNGDDYNPANPNAHMAYPDDNIQDGTCPSSHPIRLPHIFMENQFEINNIIDHIDTSTFVLAMGDETGYGWHADFFNGWDDGAIPELLNSCPQGDFGNEDIGGCPSYKGFTTKKADECKLPTTYKEKNLLNPGKVLPGCNPIVNTNPAPRLAISPLNMFTTQCKAGAGGPPAGGSPPPSSATSTRRPATTARPTTTMATSTRPTLPASYPTTTGAPPTRPSRPHGKVSCPDSHGQKIVKNGKTFEVECGVDHYAGNLKSVTAHSLGQCIRACARTEGCVDVSLSGTACYLKKELGEEVEMEGLAGAKLVTGSDTKRDAHVHRHAHKHDTF